MMRPEYGPIESRPEKPSEANGGVVRRRLTGVKQHCGGVRAGTGRRLLTALTRVRFLSPQLEESRVKSQGSRARQREVVAAPTLDLFTAG